MKICDLFKKEKYFSFEVFPPKEQVLLIQFMIRWKIKSLNPDFISVTYGAGGKRK